MIGPPYRTEKSDFGSGCALHGVQHGVQHGFRVPGCHAEQLSGRATRAAAALLPVLKRTDADPDQHRKLGLRQAHRLAHLGCVWDRYLGCAYALDLLAAHMGLHIEHALFQVFKVIRGGSDTPKLASKRGRH